MIFEKDVKSFCEEVFKEHEVYLRKFCEFKLQSQKDMVDDVINDVFLAFLEAVKKGSQIDYPKAYLTRTANNLIVDLYKNKNKEAEKTVSLSDVTENETPVYFENYDFNDISETELTKIKERILAELNEKERSLLSEYYEQKKKVTVIAKETRQTESNIKQRLLRLRKTVTYLVKTELEKEEK